MTIQRRRISLSEYSSCVETLTHNDVKELLATSAGAVDISPTPEAGSYRLKAGGKVGSIATTRLEIIIRPKIPIENVFLLIEPAHVPVELRSDVIGFGHYDELTPAFAAFFISMLEHTLARGIRHDYVVMEESSVALRGRLRMERQMRSPIATPVECRFDEYSIDTAHNRILKAASVRLLRLAGIGDANRDALRHLLMWFGEVGDNPPLPAAVLRRGFTRIDSYYEPAIRLACMVLDDTSFDQDVGEVTANSFLIDMNRAFEVFLEVRLGRSLAGRLDVAGQRPTYLDEDRRVRMKPDLVFERGGTALYVGDAKYKTTNDVSGYDSDLYQLLAYTTALGIPEGVLIYAQADGDIPSGEVRVSRAAKSLHVRRIDLRDNSAAIRRSVEDLASWIVSRTSAA